MTKLRRALDTGHWALDIGHWTLRRCRHRRIPTLLLASLILVLTGCGKDKAVQSLSKQLESKKPKARRQAVRELRDMGPRAQAAVPSLAKALKDSDPRVRRKA